MIPSEIIESKMHELEGKIDHQFRDITWLAKAMCAEKLDDESAGENYKNEALATVGDALLKFVLTDYLYDVEEMDRKGEITDERKNLENNVTLHDFVLKNGLIDYAYNEKHFHCEKNIPDHEKVLDKKSHCPYLEAIIGAVYYDSDFQIAKRWILDWLLPKLQELFSNNN